MRKVFYISCLSVFLVGCDKAVEEKPISELTSEESEAICKSPAVLSQLEANFKAGTSDYLSNSPYIYYPWISRTQEGVNYITDSAKRRKDRVDVNYKYTAETFNKGFGTTAIVKIKSPSLSASGSNDLTCSATVEFMSDELYGVSFSSPISYAVKKEDKKFITDEKLAINQLKSQKIEPTAAQKTWRDKYEAELNAKDDALRNIPDADYKVVSQEDIFYLYFAQTPRQFSDDELMGLFSNKWNNTTDVFAKEDIKKSELPQIKEKISQYKNIKNILAYSMFGMDSRRLDEKYGLKTASGEKSIETTSSWISAKDSYDLKQKGFVFNGAFCAMTGGTTISNRGVTFDVDQSLRGCIVGVPDDRAREVSAKFAEINSKGNDVNTVVKSYLHIDSIEGDRNTIHATLVKDQVQAIDPETDEVILDTVVR